MSTANYFAPYPEDRKLSTNMEITIKIDERSVEALKQGRRPDGRLIGTLNSLGNLTEVEFAPYNRKPRLREADETLYQTANGWLKQSCKRVKMWISTSRDIGMNRGAAELLREAIEMTDWMERMAKEEGEC